MKLLLTLVLLLTTEARAANLLLTCLGAEERRLHQEKSSGPFYELNQRMTAEMVQIPDVTVTPEAYGMICHSKTHSESLKLLELSLRKGGSLFIIPKKITGLQRSITQGMINDYVEISKEIFLSFISQIQTLSPTPQCLHEEIPALGQFFFEIKHLQVDVDMQKIMAGKDGKIFDEMKDYAPAFERCRERLKKKTKPSSTAVDKKP